MWGGHSVLAAPVEPIYATFPPASGVEDPNGKMIVFPLGSFTAQPQHRIAQQLLSHYLANSLSSQGAKANENGCCLCTKMVEGSLIGGFV
jgi:hypothetical protein